MRGLLRATLEHQSTAGDSGDTEYESQRELQLALSQKTKSIRPEPFPRVRQGCLLHREDLRKDRIPSSVRYLSEGHTELLLPLFNLRQVTHAEDKI